MNYAKKILDKLANVGKAHLVIRIVIWTICGVVGWQSGSWATRKYVLPHTQTYRINQFLTNFTSEDSDRVSMFNEDLELVGHAKDPKECMVTVEALWMLVDQHKNDGCATREDMAHVAYDRIVNYCK